jgi:hypothetical protein
VVLAADYPFLDVFWTMLVFFLWVIWFWLLITVFTDIFRRHNLSGWGKAAWMIFVIVLPYLGVFIYLITQSRHMAERNVRDVQAAQSQLDDRIRSVAGGGGAAAEIEKAKQLLDSGAITQAEYEAIKQKSLAG